MFRKCNRDGLSRFIERLLAEATRLPEFIREKDSLSRALGGRLQRSGPFTDQELLSEFVQELSRDQTALASLPSQNPILLDFLAPADRPGFASHLSSCPRCATRLRQQVETAQLLKTVELRFPPEIDGQRISQIEKSIVERLRTGRTPVKAQSEVHYDTKEVIMSTGGVFGEPRFKWFLSGLASGVAVMAAVYFAVVYPWPREAETAGSMAGVQQAERFHSEQMTDKDVLLKNPEVQQFLQNDQVQKLMRSGDMAKLMYDASFREALDTQLFRDGLSNSFIRDAFGNQLFREAVDNSLFREALNNSFFREALSNDIFRAALSNGAMREALNNSFFRQSLADRNFRLLFSNSAFWVALNDKAFAQSLNNDLFRDQRWLQDQHWLQHWRESNPGLELNALLRDAMNNQWFRQALTNAAFRDAVQQSFFRDAMSNAAFLQAMDSSFFRFFLNDDAARASLQNTAFMEALNNNLLRDALNNDSLRGALNNSLFREALSNSAMRDALQSNLFRDALNNQWFREALNNAALRDDLYGSHLNPAGP